MRSPYSFLPLSVWRSGCNYINSFCFFPRCNGKNCKRARSFIVRAVVFSVRIAKMRNFEIKMNEWTNKMKVALRIEGRKKHAQWNFTVELICECIFSFCAPVVVWVQTEQATKQKRWKIALMSGKELWGKRTSW